jgi:hypothetical protein
MRFILGVLRRSGDDAGPVSRRRGPVPLEGDTRGHGVDFQVPEGFASDEVSGIEGIVMMAGVLEYTYVNRKFFLESTLVWRMNCGID